jgi:hypothetical protein
MTELTVEANVADIADQSVPVGEPDLEMDQLTEAFTATAEADIVDIIEQHQSVALPHDSQPSMHDRRWWVTANKPFLTDFSFDERTPTWI